MSIFDKLDRTILRNIKVTHEHTPNPNPDSLSIGTAGKGGEIKVYGNFNNPEDFQRKVDAALKIRAYTNQQMYGVDPKWHDIK